MKTVIKNNIKWLVLAFFFGLTAVIGSSYGQNSPSSNPSGKPDQYAVIQKTYNTGELGSAVVKVVVDGQGRALYFSRAPIPWPRDAFTTNPRVLPSGLPVRRHIGLYAYRTVFLRQYSQLSPSVLEQWESLEQLRALANGFVIRVVDCLDAPAPGVDTPEDLARVRLAFDHTAN